MHTISHLSIITTCCTFSRLKSETGKYVEHAFRVIKDNPFLLLSRWFRKNDRVTTLRVMNGIVFLFNYVVTVTLIRTSNYSVWVFVN